MLRDRLILGPIFIAALIAMVWVDDWLERTTGLEGVLVLPALVAIGVVAARELNAIFRLGGLSTDGRMTALVCVLGVLVSGLTRRDIAGFSGVALVSTIGVGVQLVAMLYYSRTRELRGVTAAASATLLAFVYLGLLGGFLFIIRREFDHGGWLLLVILLITKSSDISAFFVGRAIGRHKLIPWISPGKTWEGFAGGVAGAALVAWGIAELTADDWPARAFSGPVAIAVGAVFGVVAQGGDLVASMLKRDAGVKDSSRAIPGFGGILDVIDSPLLVAPVAYWLLTAAQELGG